jgi:hypothetical protein
MFVALKLKQTNIAEYLLYMWQIEDLIRANHLNIDELKETIISQYHATAEQNAQLEQWYTDLINMMCEEGIKEKGHLQICKNVIISLTDLHLQLLHSDKFPFYTSAYYKILPFIVELRHKGENTDKPELETCFDALYGVTMLRLQKKEISEQTATAVADISKFLSMLAQYHIQDKKGELKFDDEDENN